MRVEEDAVEQKNAKWIHEGIYMVNTKTGRRINKITKKIE